MRYDGLGTIIEGIFMVRVCEVTVEVYLRVVTMVVLPQVLLALEELSTVSALDHFLFLINRQFHQVFIGAQGLLLDFELFAHHFQLCL